MGAGFGRDAILLAGPPYFRSVWELEWTYEERVKADDAEGTGHSGPEAQRVRRVR